VQCAVIWIDDEMKGEEWMKGGDQSLHEWCSEEGEWQWVE
jgi:hypothetical protein